MTAHVSRSHGRSGQARRFVVVLCVLSLGLAACGNSGDDDDDGAADTTSGDDNASTGGEAASGDRDTFVEISGVPGVTDDEIQYSIIGTKSNNPLGTCILDCYAAGVEAYFAYRNSEGGIYGRDLVVSETLDDELANNQVRALDVISADDTFGNFNATLAPSGWGDLDQAGIPTYVWGIHGNEMAGREHIFGHIQGPCSGCTGRVAPLDGRAGGRPPGGHARLRHHRDVARVRPRGGRLVRDCTAATSTPRRCTSRTTSRTGCPTASHPRSRP